jgi:hypothetical protein
MLITIYYYSTLIFFTLAIGSLLKIINPRGELEFRGQRTAKRMNIEILQIQLMGGNLCRLCIKSAVPWAASLELHYTHTNTCR